VQQALLQHFAEAAAAVLSQIAGTALQAAPASEAAANQADASETPETAAATLLRIEITGALQGVCEIALSAVMSSHFAALLTGETPDLTAETISSDTREAAAELIQQICGNAADRLRRAFGPLELKPHLAEADPGSGPRQLILITGGSSTLELELYILSLAAEPKPIEAKPAEATPAEATPDAQQSAPPPSSQPMAHSTAPTATNRNLDLLLDIELGVTLRFGTRQMLLKDVIELCSGSVVELDRRVEEPVELLIDGRLIAHGEVVIVEGNYGLRVTQVAAPGERIACLP
jgi:flagellar motor switch protein FliN